MRHEGDVANILGYIKNLNMLEIRKFSSDLLNVTSHNTRYRCRHSNYIPLIVNKEVICFSKEQGGGCKITIFKLYESKKSKEFTRILNTYLVSIWNNLCVVNKCSTRLFFMNL